MDVNEIQSFTFENRFNVNSNNQQNNPALQNEMEKVIAKYAKFAKKVKIYQLPNGNSYIKFDLPDKYDYWFTEELRNCKINIIE